jgi:uncharacterized membrane protein YhdT
VAGILLVVLLFTGGINLHYVNQIFVSQTGQGMQNHPKYLWIFCIKLILVLCLLTLFLYTVIFKSDQDEEEEGETTNRFRSNAPRSGWASSSSSAPPP